MSLTDLISQRDALARKQAELEKAIAEAQSETRKGVMEEIRRLMAAHGISAADLNTNPRGRPPKNTDHGNAGSKVAPKFRDPDTGATWSGRGLKPKWLSAALESGKELTDFAIDSPTE
jgi:DNA-binding protein H-NS